MGKRYITVFSLSLPKTHTLYLTLTLTHKSSSLCRHGIGIFNSITNNGDNLLGCLLVHFICGPLLCFCLKTLTPDLPLQ
ncbi:hypothetical protein L2E82_33142 [Cichorium intybus]|uniref:Uncharacterized protein n=1 Tax=Cichorium intybus TaxID=13427 RepID=A0ACB9BJD6_CICIN|nr:hypothetical protein L2E82_33142 [Cichorium intybus]